MDKPKLIFYSTGIKKNKPLAKLGLLVDCRIVIERHEEGETGKQKLFRDFVEKTNLVQLNVIEMFIKAGIDALPARRDFKKDWAEKPLEVLFFCAHGIHRSVATKHLMAKRFEENGYKVEVRDEPEEKEDK